jgi:hypothetical protein
MLGVSSLSRQTYYFRPRNSQLTRSLLASPFAAPQKQRRNSLKVMANVDEIANKRSKLKADQTNVTGTSDEEVRPPPDGKGAARLRRISKGTSTKILSS